MPVCCNSNSTRPETQPMNPDLEILPQSQSPVPPATSASPPQPDLVPADPEGPNPESQLVKSRHTRTGNVARLPKDVRDRLNHMLHENVPYRLIIKTLGEAGRGLSINNISNGKTDGVFDEFLL